MSGPSRALERLEAVVGGPNLVTATAEVGEYAVEGQTPLAAAFPGSAAEVAETLREAAEAQLSVLLRGAGQHMYLGAPPGPIGVVVSLARLAEVVEYDPEELTVTAQAGVTLGALQQVLGERGQMLPLDPPGGETATLGGIAAANLAGPMRMRYGSPRDLVIGMRVALTTGELVKTGGKTVKNVAGYDLGKLFIGSMGTVGAICELTLRLIPVPEGKAALVCAMEPAEALALAAHVVGSRLPVTSVEIVNPAGAERLRGLPVTTAGRYLMVIGVAGEREGIGRQDREIRGLARNGWVRLEGEEAEELGRRVRDFARPQAPSAALLRLSVPIGRTREMLALASSEVGWEAVARAGDGLVFAAAPVGTEASRIKERFSAMRAAAEGWGGHAVLESGPVELKREFPVWGEGPRNVDLMRELKRSYDPAGVLGCGRFVRGL